MLAEVTKFLSSASKLAESTECATARSSAWMIKSLDPAGKPSRSATVLLCPIIGAAQISVTKNGNRILCECMGAPHSQLSAITHAKVSRVQCEIVPNVFDRQIPVIDSRRAEHICSVRLSSGIVLHFLGVLNPVVGGKS